MLYKQLGTFGPGREKWFIFATPKGSGFKYNKAFFNADEKVQALQARAGAASIICLYYLRTNR